MAAVLFPSVWGDQAVAWRSTCLLFLGLTEGNPISPGPSIQEALPPSLPVLGLAGSSPRATQCRRGSETGWGHVDAKEGVGGGGGGWAVKLRAPRETERG